MIHDSTQNVVILQKKRLIELKAKLKNQYEYALCFINSKDEVVRNSAFSFPKKEISELD